MFQIWEWAQSSSAITQFRAVMGETWRQFLERTVYDLLNCPELDIQMLSYWVLFGQDRRVRSNVSSGDSGGKVNNEAKEMVL